MGSEFVGVDRHELVDDLVEAFGRVSADDGGPEVHCLVGRIGLGKTRVIQELFARLAEDQAEPSYWPERIADAQGVGTGLAGAADDARKAIVPTRFEVPGGAVLEWFWWGFSCGERPDPSVLGDAHEQLFTHAAALAETEGWEGRAKRAAVSNWTPRLSALAGIVGFFVGSVGTAATVADLLAQASDEGKGLRAARRLRREAASDRMVNLAQVDHSDRIWDLAERLAIYSAEAPRLPVVMVVDDAHNAHEDLVRLLSLVTGRSGAAVLVVAAGWPDLLDAQVGIEGTFGSWLAGLTDTVGYRHDLADLDRMALAEMITEIAPGTQASVRDALVDRASGNPYVLDLLLGLGPVRRSVDGGAITLTAAEVARLPNGVAKLWEARWDELPQAVRDALAVAAVQGDRYVEPAVAHAAVAAGLADAAQAVPAAVDPYQWARQIDATLRSFVEAAHFQVAAGGHLRDDELDQIRAALIDHILETRTDGWDDLEEPTRRRLLEIHVTLAAEGFTDNLHAAARSGLLLADLHSTVYDFPGAIGLARQAIGWWADEPDHPEALTGRANLASWLGEAGRVHDAVGQLTVLVDDCRRVLGDDHPDTLAARHNLASWLGTSGRADEAIGAFTVLVDDCRRVLGDDHPDTLAARNDLAWWLGRSGRVKHAVEQLTALVDDDMRVLGADHPDTLTARSNLAWWLGRSGRIDVAVDVSRTVVDDRLRVLGGDHPATLAARASLAGWLGESGCVAEAVAEYSTLVDDYLRVLGADHPDTLTARNNLARWLGRSGQFDLAVEGARTVVNDRLRVLGPDHPDTLAARNNLAWWSGQSERVDEAIEAFDVLVPDCLRVLRPDDPATLAARNDRALLLGRVGRVEEAVREFTVLIDDRLRVLGADHPATVAAQASLAELIAKHGRGSSGNRETT